MTMTPILPRTFRDLSAPLLAAAWLGLAVTLIAPAPAAIADEGTARYCIARGGANGDASYTGSCVYSDYQQCLQAAADSRGNCVQNIDYRPGASSSPAAARSRHAR
jgi:hypothetical protein